MMHVVVVGVSQGLSFETGESSNYLTLLLPNGRRVMASVNGDDVEEITRLFINGGGPAAQTAIARATADTSAPSSMPDSAQAEAEAAAYVRMSRGSAPETHGGAFSPMSFADGGGDGEEAISTFGGDDPELDEVGRSLQQAEEKLANAIGDTTSMGPAELRQVVSRIQSADPVLPVPNVMAKPPTQGRRLSGPKVQADEMGNPVITGPGLVDPRSLMGGNTDGEEDVGQV